MITNRPGLERRQSAKAQCLPNRQLTALYCLIPPRSQHYPGGRSFSGTTAAASAGKVTQVIGAVVDVQVGPTEYHRQFWRSGDLGAHGLRLVGKEYPQETLAIRRIHPQNVRKVAKIINVG